MESEEFSEKIINFKTKEDINIEEYLVVGDGNNEIFNLSFSPDDKYIATACNGGKVNIYSTITGNKYFEISKDKTDFGFTSVKWRYNNNGLNNVIYTTNTDGEFQMWHLNTEKNLFTYYDKNDKIVDSQLNNLDLSQDEKIAAFVGGHPIVNILDLETRKKIISLDGDGSRINGHSSRVFSVKFVNEVDENLLISGGWDNRIILWDLRDKVPIESLYGHKICGDGIDIFEGLLLTTSYVEKNQIQIYDLNSRRYLTKQDSSEFNWYTGKNKINITKPSLCYTSKFNKTTGSYILSGCATSNEAKIFDLDGINIATFGGFSKEILTVDFSQNDNLFGFGGANGYAWIYKTDLFNNSEDDENN